MLIHGKERNFKLTVGASVAISGFCPGRDLKRMGELLSGPYADTVTSIARIIVELNRGYEEARSFEEPGYVPDVITEAELFALGADELTSVQAAALAAFGRDAEPSVETEEAKKKENAAET